MNRLTTITLLIICVVINIVSLIWIGYNVHPILSLILIIVETWIVASIIKTEPKQNNNQGKLKL